MVRDLERTCAALDLPFAMPTPFPQNTLLCARIATALEGPLRSRFAQAVYQMEFGEGRSISDPLAAAEALRRAGLDAALVERAQADDVESGAARGHRGKRKRSYFRRADARHRRQGIVLGNYRLEAALDWAVQGHL